jgi:hypothetical protein
LGLHRFWYSNDKRDTGLVFVGYWLMRFKAYCGGYAQGYGRFRKEEFYEICKKDLNALNTIVGSKKFLFGDDKPCEYDASVFGMCVQFIHQDRGPLNHHIMSEPSKTKTKKILVADLRGLIGF